MAVLQKNNEILAAASSLLADASVVLIWKSLMTLFWWCLLARMATTIPHQPFRAILKELHCHPSIIFLPLMGRITGQQPEQIPKLPTSSTLSREAPKYSRVCRSYNLSGMSWTCPPGRTYPEHLTTRLPGGIQVRCLNHPNWLYCTLSSSQMTALFTPSLRERPDILRWKLFPTACIRDLILLVSSQSLTFILSSPCSIAASAPVHLSISCPPPFPPPHLWARPRGT